MASKYIDSTSIIQVIGSVYNTPQLLDYGDKYVITENDFDTSHPNSNRIDRVACEINRYLRRKWETVDENEAWYI
jgi:hypothetical protein